LLDSLAHARRVLRRAARRPVGLALLLGTNKLLGHWTGSHLGLKKGADAIRPAVVLVCAGLFAKLLLDCL
jgi:uncharacterized membrane protein YfcA